MSKGLASAMLAALVVTGVSAGIAHRAAIGRSEVRAQGFESSEFAVALNRWMRSFSAMASAIRGQISSPASVPQSASASTAAPMTGEAIAVNGSQPLWVPIQLDLSGDVIDLSANAAPVAVVVNVGGRAFPATISGGGYEAKIDALRPEDMVVVDVTAPNVHYRSVLGSFSNVTLYSNGDRRVDRSELPALRVSAFTTATQWLVNRSLGGRDAMSDDEYERATRATTTGYDSAFNTVTMLSRIASALEKIALGNATMPAGFTDGLALLQDAPAFAQFLTDSGTGAADELYPFTHPAVAPLASLSEVPARLLLSSAWSPNHVPTSVLSLDILTADGAGQYSLHRKANLAAAPHATATFRASISASGDLVLDALNGAGSETNTYPRTHKWLSRVVLRRMSIGARYSVWASQETLATSDPDMPAKPPSSFETQTLLRTGFDLDGSSRPNPWGNSISGNRALPWMCARPFTRENPTPQRYLLDGCEYAQHLFAPNGTGWIDDFGYKADEYMRPKAGGFGPSFIWTLAQGGGVQVRADEATTTYWNVDAGDGTASVVVYLAQGQGSNSAGQSVVGMGLTVTASPFPVFADQMIGTWVPSTSDAFAASKYPGLSSPLEIRRSADGTSQYYTDRGGIFDAPFPSNWEIVNGRVFDTRYRARTPGGPTYYVQNCTIAASQGATECSRFMLRHFRPLARVGSRLYGLSDVYLDSTIRPFGYTGTYAPDRTSSFLEIIGCSAGPCRSAFGTFGAFSVPSVASKLDSAIAAPILSRSPMVARRNADLRL